MLPAARFTIGELLGRGMHTEVYSAQDRLLRRSVAVKVFPVNPDPVACRRIADEARALDRLRHRGLVSVFDGGLHRSRPYLVMQLVRGPSLHAYLRTGALPTPQVVAMGALLADALAHVHQHGVVHRDIKPSNILLDQQGMPYLGDFGIALLPEETRLTSVDEIIGTPAYLSPEQVRGGELTPAVDIYALGLVLVECITGEREYADPNKITAAISRLKRPPRIPTGLPVRMARLLRAMTADDPARRPPASVCRTTLEVIGHNIAASDPEGLTRPLRASDLAVAAEPEQRKGRHRQAD
ncbi:MAG TPA: serine/threonine-protein kinase [Pseudonocardiaceae bacterium]|jgi:serine/threonine protein kinase